MENTTRNQNRRDREAALFAHIDECLALVPIPKPDLATPAPDPDGRLF